MMTKAGGSKKMVAAEVGENKQEEANNNGRSRLEQDNDGKRRQVKIGKQEQISENKPLGARRQWQESR